MENSKKRIKILLIDDNEMMKLYFRDVFWIHGKGDVYDIKMVSTLEEVENVLNDEKQRPDTIFLDILMSSGEKSGNAPAYQMARSLEFISKIKNDEKYHNIKIIIFSSQKEDYLKEAAQGLGVDGYLVKGELMPREIVSFTDKIHGTNN